MRCGLSGDGSQVPGAGCQVPVIDDKSGARYICKILLGLRFQQNVFLCLPLLLLNLCVRGQVPGAGCQVPVIEGKSVARYMSKILLGLSFQQNVFLCLPLLLLNLCLRGQA